jgi:hypothetical protein
MGYAGVDEQFSQAFLIGAGEPILLQRLRPRAQDQCQIHGRMPGHREGELRAIGIVLLHRHHQQRGGIQNRRQHGQPRLIVMLRSVVTEHGERKVALQKLGRP